MQTSVPRTFFRRRLRSAALVVFAFALASCSDDAGGGDAGPSDQPKPLASCDRPGFPCDPQNACAVDPVCRVDHQCWAKVQSCDDKLSCTVDTCLGPSTCEHAPKPGFCALTATSSSSSDGGTGGADPVTKCFRDGDRHPDDQCKICRHSTTGDGEGSPPGTSWADANGLSCDDNYACSKDDQCDNGLCRGTDYAAQCNDNLPCTHDGCDGKGGCLKHELRPGWCLIGGQCYMNDTSNPANNCSKCDTSKSTSSWTSIGNGCTIDGNCYSSGDKNPVGCGQCDPSSSTSKWTIKSTSCCLIGGSSYQSGAKDPTGCYTCDPSTSKTSWTKASNTCLIGGSCYASGAMHSGGCASCDPTKSKTSWTPQTGSCLIRDACYSSGATHPQGCASCDPTKSQTSWTPTSTSGCIINGQCQATGDKDPVGCATCDPTQSQTSWTPTSGCFKIVFSALDEAHTGSLGGVAAADAACAKQAKRAGRPGTFKAFLSTSTRDVKDLITGTNASTIPVVTTHGVQLYLSWNDMFTSSTLGSSAVYTFDDTLVSNSFSRDGDAWHGSTPSGTVASGDTCKDWTSSDATNYGANGEIDVRRWLGTERSHCSVTLAVICVQTAP